MAEYEMQELTLPNEDGKRVLFPRLIQHGQVDLKELAQQIAMRTPFPRGVVEGLVEELATEMAFHLARGWSVKVDGIGVFTLALGLQQGKERENGEKDEKKRNARSIGISDINFRVDKELLLKTAKWCTLERSKHKFRRSSNKFTPEQRLTLAQEYLKQNPYMKIADYCQLTGMLHCSASRELRRWSHQPDSGIASEGKSPHKVYVSRKTT